MKKGYLCESCGKFTEETGSQEDKPWLCPICDKEVCSKCFSKYAACQVCASLKTDKELIDAANEYSMFNFEYPENQE